MLEARKLHFGHRHHAVGRDLDLKVERGEAMCLIGPNGAGKTTLLKTLLGLIEPLSGEVFLNGEPLAARTRRDVARTLAYVPQAHAAFFPFTTADLVLMGRAARVDVFDAPNAADRAVAAAAIDRLRIGHLAERPYTQLSGGERQLALIARALTQEPACLVMDEPTANLDIGNQARVLSEIAALTASGLTVVFSSHDPNHALMCADRVALMRDGALTEVGPPEEIISADMLESLYGAAVHVEFSAGAGRKVCTPLLHRGGASEAKS